jgi:hypothetical protein
MDSVCGNAQTAEIARLILQAAVTSVLPLFRAIDEIQPQHLLTASCAILKLSPSLPESSTNGHWTSFTK